MFAYTKNIFEVKKTKSKMINALDEERSYNLIMKLIDFMHEFQLNQFSIKQTSIS